MTRPDRVPAVGGATTVPAPDAIARDYLLLALRLDQHDPGLVHAFVGPAELKARVDLERVPSPGRLRDEARDLRARLTGEVPEPDRRTWLDAQLVALETRAAVVAGEAVPFPDQVERGLGCRPRPRPSARLEEAAAELDRLLPGEGPLGERSAAWDARLAIERDRLPGVVDWLLEKLRRRAAVRFGLPPGESVRAGFVRGRTSGVRAWWEGAGRSRLDVPADRPIPAPDLVATLARLTYGGHHLERAWKEAVLVEGAGRVEATALVVPAPEALIGGGVAETGAALLLWGDAPDDLLAEVLDRAALDLGGPAAAREVAATAVAIAPWRRLLGEAVVNATLMHHVDGASPDEVLALLRSGGRDPGSRAGERLAELEDPRRWTCAFARVEGAELVRRWLELAPAAERPARFGRLLREPLTPGRLAAEITVATDDGPARA